MELSLSLKLILWNSLTKTLKMCILRLLEEINFFHLKRASHCNTKIGTNETTVGYEKELIINPISD